MTELRGVLFDMDGTLCDTEPAWMASEWKLARLHNADWTQQDSLDLVGFNLLTAGEYIKERMGLSISAEEVVDAMITQVIEHVRHKGVDWRPGAVELLQACNDAGIPTAIVTMSYRPLVDAVLEVLPAGRFDAVVAGDEVSRGKPAPDPYLAGAAALGVDPRGCVAIEDSPTGAMSAYAAGCLVVAVPNHVAVPLTGDMVSLPTLHGVRPDDLAGLLGQR